MRLSTLMGTAALVSLLIAGGAQADTGTETRAIASKDKADELVAAIEAVNQPTEGVAPAATAVKAEEEIGDATPPAEEKTEEKKEAPAKKDSTDSAAQDKPAEAAAEKTTMERAREAIDQAGKTVAEKASEAMDAVKKATATAVQKTREALGAAEEETEETAEKTAETVEDTADAAAETAEDVGDAAADAAEDAAEAAEDAAETVTDEAEEAVPDGTVDDTVEAAQDAAEEAGEAAADTAEDAADAAEDAAEAVADTADEATTDDTVEDTVEAAQDAAEDAAETVTETAEDAVDAASKAAGDAADATEKAAEDAAKAVEEMIEDVVDPETDEGKPETPKTESAAKDGEAQDFAQGAQPVGAACTPPASDDPATWLCENEGNTCSTSNAAKWVSQSAEYQALVAQTFRFAGLEVRDLAKAHKAGTWAVAVDLDETVISNSAYTVQREMCGRGYSRASWHNWSAAEQATPLPGAKTFMKLVYDLGGLIVGVTNRRESEAPYTVTVLERHGLPIEFVLYRGDSDSATGEKEARWAQVPGMLAKKGHKGAKIVMWMGDQITDFPGLDQSVYAKDGNVKGPFGTKYIVLPNPMYGEWEHSK